MRIALALIVLCLLVPPGGAGEQKGFFTAEELLLLDDALALTNMTRRDLTFDKLTGLEDYRAFRLPVVDRTLENPLEAASFAAEWGERAPGTPAELLREAGRVLALDAAAIHDGDDPFGDALELCRAAVKDLSPEGKARLVRWAYAAMISEDVHDGLYPKPEGEPEPEEMLALAGKVDVAKFEEAARLLFDAGLENAADWADPDLGYVKVAGPGDDVHDLSEDAPLILIDLGGNDRYVAPARATPDRPVAIVIDLGGDDVYGAGESLSAGAGFFGVGILVDRGGGNDLYRGGHLSQGTGLFGVGVLEDDGGNDVYECKDTGQGAGAWGIGLLLDRGEGNDRFHADLFGQGFAYVGGFGLLHNEKGQDVYEAGGVHLHYPLFNDRYQSLSQGFSIGMRPYASGGVALLVDDAGNDRYACDIYGQGASYWFAYGALIDRDGNDTYTLGQYGQGGGIHLAVGCLLDLAGQDLYYNMHGVGTGGAHDFAVGILVDRAGDDYYAGSGGTLGGALTNSFALLLDAAGNDGYSAVKVRHTEGGGRSARGMGSIGVLLDMGGKDLHGTSGLEGAAWTKETYGAGIDLKDPPSPPGKAPPRRPHLTPDEAERRLRESAWDEEAGAFDLEKVWDVAQRWAVGEMADVVPLARAKLVEMGEPALAHTLDRVGTKISLEFEAVRDVLKRFGVVAVQPLVGLVESGDDRTRSRAAGLLADLGAAAAAPVIAGLLGEKKTRLGALDALSRLKAREVWEAVAGCLDDETERVRVSAIRCLEKMAEPKALGAIADRMRDGEVFTVRFAAEDALVSFGVGAVARLDEVARTLSDVTYNRHGIRALGRIASPESFSLLVALSDHEDWRVRYEVAHALGGYLRSEDPQGAMARKALADRAGREESPYVSAALARLLSAD